jgi:hypothetical protein
MALVAAATALFAGGLALGSLALREQSSHFDGLPVAAVSSVRVLQSPYVQPPAEPEPALAEQPPLPIATPEAPAGAPPLPASPPAARQPTARQKVPTGDAPVPAAQAGAPATPDAKQPPPASLAPPSARQEPRPPTAVVLDEPEPRPARMAAPAGAGTDRAAAPATQAASMVQTAPMPAASAAVSRRPAQAGFGLIAITPDGKLAVFTNPKTQLPQQFTLGEQLPGGDTIRFIDAKEGKVISSTKEYSLE